MLQPHPDDLVLCNVLSRSCNRCANANANANGKASAEHAKAFNLDAQTIRYLQRRKRPLHFLSLFSGIAGFELGIYQLFPNAVCVGFCEIDKGAITIYLHHYPGARNLGDITQVSFKEFRTQIDLVVGGSPCTDLSAISPNRADQLKGTKSRLFFHFVRCLKECRPQFFLLENVGSMKKDSRSKMTDILSSFGGLEPALVDAAMFTAQRRRRLFWSNFKIFDLHSKSPDNAVAQTFATRILQHKYGRNRAPSILDIIEPKKIARDQAHTPKLLHYFNNEVGKPDKLGKRKRRIEAYGYYTRDSSADKSKCILASVGSDNSNLVIDQRFTPPLYRKWTVREVERLQGFPDGYTDCLRDPRDQLKALGNAVAPPVIAYIMQCFQRHLVES